MNATIATNMLLMMMMMMMLLLLMMMLMVMIDCHDGESPNDFEDGICAMRLCQAPLSWSSCARSPQLMRI